LELPAATVRISAVRLFQSRGTNWKPEDAIAEYFRVHASPRTIIRMIIIAIMIIETRSDLEGFFQGFSPASFAASLAAIRRFDTFSRH